MARSIIIFIGGKELDFSILKKVLPDSYEILRAPNAQDGLLLYQTCFTKTKLIFIDQSITDIAVDELIKKIHNVSVLPEIIVMSETLDSETVIETMRLGVRDYLESPFNEDLLSYIISQVEDDYLNLKKIENLAKSVMIDQLEEKMELIQELAEHRKSEGKTVSKEEISIFFSNQSPEKKLSITENINTLLRQEIEPDDYSLPQLLIVEDEDQLRVSLEKKLRRSYDIHLAQNGKEALEMAKKDIEIDLILLDIGLPDMSGLDLLTEFRNLQPDTEIIMLTAYRDVSMIVKSFNLHACDYITKPFDGKVLQSKLSHALQRRYFRKVMPNIGKAVLSEKLALRDKLSILDDVSTMRRDHQKDFLMKDIYLFFPELKESGIEDTTPVTPADLEDGLLLFIETLSQEIKKKTVVD